ncbi:MAG: LuxR C-terminal-related transcriptional regulator [Sulfuricurvum sp.]|nr:LuxR C-terminal-related transcriptional regulator [Sulfuricurvum sp.]
MKLYLISDNNILATRWMTVFADAKAVFMKEFSVECENDSIVFISDTIVNALSEQEIENLFSRRVMLLSINPDFTQAQNFLQMGAMGYGNAMMHETHLHSAYQALTEGKVWLHPDFITMMISKIHEIKGSQEKSLHLLDELSKREREVALMLGEGASHQDIADELDITVRTVKAHATAIYQKLEVKDRLALSLLLHK